MTLNSGASTINRTLVQCSEAPVSVAVLEFDSLPVGVLIAPAVFHDDDEVLVRVSLANKTPCCFANPGENRISVPRAVLSLYFLASV